MSLGEKISSGSATTKLLLHLNGNSTDSSGNGNDLTNNNGVSFVNGKFGLCADTPSGNTNQDLTSTTSPLTDIQVTAGFTISGWCKLKDLNKVQIITHFNANSSSGRRQAQIHVHNDNKPWFQGFALNVGGSSIDLPGVSTLTTGVWYNILATYNGTTFKLYLNGNFESSLNATYANAFAQSSRLSVFSAQSNNYFSGSIDEVIIENRAWSASEVAKQYSYQKGRFGII